MGTIRKPPPANARALYVTGTILDKTIKFQLDTGCSDVIVAIPVFQSIPEEQRPQLSQPLEDLTQASGLHLNNLGSAWIDVTCTCNCGRY